MMDTKHHCCASPADCVFTPEECGATAPCIECPAGPLDGILASVGHGNVILVERCDACGRYEGDLDAALVLTHLVGGTVKFEQDPASEIPWQDDADVDREIRTFDGTDNPTDCIAFGTNCWLEGADLDRFATIQVISDASPPCAIHTVAASRPGRLLAGMGF